MRITFINLIKKKACVSGIWWFFLHFPFGLTEKRYKESIQNPPLVIKEYAYLFWFLRNFPQILDLPETITFIEQTKQYYIFNILNDYATKNKLKEDTKEKLKELFSSYFYCKAPYFYALTKQLNI